MSLNDVPSADRIHIGFFGARNAGKSSLVNAVTGQMMSIVSETAGTTTDAVTKTMELLPLGPVVITDTAGYDDDDAALGAQRIEKTRLALYRTDLAVLVIDATRSMGETEQELVRLFQAQNIPYLVAMTHADLLASIPADCPSNTLYVSAKTGMGIHALKEAMGQLAHSETPPRPLLRDLICPSEMIVLVTPIDASAPKGRMILPQVQALRDLLDGEAIAIFTQPAQLAATLAALREPPRMVVTDSQAFAQVAEIVPQEVPLTSFSILLARYKGFLKEAVAGIRALETLPSGAKILIAEGCTHHRQCNDIGTVKLPRALQRYAGKEFAFAFCSGGEFPEDVSPYKLVVHCGGCMRSERELQWRMRCALAQGVPFTNYGIVLAACGGILERALMDGALIDCHDTL